MEDRDPDTFTVVNTRPRHQADELSDRLRAIGAEPVECPALAIVEPTSWEPVDRALNDLSSYDWLGFTSQNGVHRCFDRSRELGLDGALKDLPAAAIGSATAAALRDRKGSVALVPDDFCSEGLADALVDELDPGASVLLPRSNVARPVLVDTLSDAGIRVNEVHPYELRRPADLDPNALERLREGGVNLICFTSSMIVRNFDALLADQDLRELRDTPAACIGPVTEETARERGYAIPVVADEYTIEGLIRKISQHVRNLTQTT